MELFWAGINISGPISLLKIPTSVNLGKKTKNSCEVYVIFTLKQIPNGNKPTNVPPPPHKPEQGVRYVLDKSQWLNIFS